VKGVVADPRLQARAVILDPALTVETPAWLWASTGMRALDHAVEGSYSTRHQLVTDTLASKAIALLNAHLLPSLQTHGDDELEHRVQCQLAAWLSIFGMSSNSRGGISHALGHQIGPMWNVPHGITSCITLPHVMRLMAGVAADRFAPIAQGFEVRSTREVHAHRRWNAPIARPGSSASSTCRPGFVTSACRARRSRE
jgi:alcohol dehydrogenase class IV